jgi:hypothetical protein
MKQIYWEIIISRRGLKKAQIGSICCDTPVTELLVPDILKEFSSSILLDCLICEYEGAMSFQNTGNP